LWVQNNFSNNVINIAHGTPYIVVGTGITADFLYPIVSIERPTPNFSIESINYISESGYNRIYDSFRSNATEKYIVCKSIDYSSVQSLINDLQKTCNQIMN
jgi:putative ABC transport system permease protein